MVTHHASVTPASAENDLLADPYAPEHDWPYLRRAVLEGGGIGPSVDWPRDWYPADLYRANGPAPDLVAAECTLRPWERDGVTGDDGAMFGYLRRAYAAWSAAPSAERFTLAETPRARAARQAGKAKREMAAKPAPMMRAPGTRSFAELVAELKRKHGADVELSGLRSEYVHAYETGERVTIERDGREYRGTIGATRGPRPRFVLLLSLDL
jgi:hypothetical protein